MAKLSARGRKELARVESITIPEVDRSVNWQRITRTLMSDGVILQKIDVRFPPDQFRPEGEKHSYGWTVYGKAKPGVTAERFVALYVDRGWHQI